MLTVRSGNWLNPFIRAAKCLENVTTPQEYDECEGKNHVYLSSTLRGTFVCSLFVLGGEVRMYRKYLD